jgi:hypothetical protein
VKRNKSEKGGKMPHQGLLDPKPEARNPQRGTGGPPVKNSKTSRIK